MLIILAFFDTNKKLYGSIAENGVGQSSSFVNEDLGVIYVLRNAFTYIPIMFFYFFNRGVLSLKFIKCLFFVFILLSPFGIYSFTSAAFGDTPLTLENILLYGQTYIPFNTYVPFLGLIICICLYFIHIETNGYIKFYSILLYFNIVFYTFLSSSRQSLLFIIVATLLFMYYSFNYRSLLVFLLFICLVVVGLIFLTSNYNINSEVIAKFLDGGFSAASESSRIGKIREGFGLMETYEYLIGSGISSVPFSGPHNDFVRWIQRAGVFVGLFGFLPFFLLMRASISSYRLYKDKIYLFILSTSIFTIFTSFFGYPRDDTFQSLFVFSGIILLYGIDRSSLIKFNQKS